MAQIPDEAGQNWNKNDTQDKECQVLFDEWQVTKVIAPQYKKTYPKNRTYQAEQYKMPVSHASHTRYKRREGTNNWQEASEDDGFATMFLIECVRFFQVCAIQKPRFLAGK